jgi:hypothetical protein
MICGLTGEPVTVVSIKALANQGCVSVGVKARMIRVSILLRNTALSFLWAFSAAPALGNPQSWVEHNESIAPVEHVQIGDIQGPAANPGWERSRGCDWMDLGRLQRFSTRIAQADDMDLYFGLNTVGRTQYLQQSNVFDSIGSNSVVPGPLEPGIQTPFGQFAFLADFNRAIEVYFNIFIATRPHEDFLQADEGYLLLRHLDGPMGESQLVQAFFDRANVKFGAFEIDFGDQHYRRSNNADVLRNPLIGNQVIDPRATDIGFEVFGVPGDRRLNWLLGVGVGTTGDFQANRGLQFHGKLFATTMAGFRPSISFFYADHSDNPPGFPGPGSKSDLFRSNRSGGPYEDVFGAGNAPGDITPSNGQNVAAVQLDMSWLSPVTEAYGNIGMVQDSDTNGSSIGTPREVLSIVVFLSE